MPETYRIVLSKRISKDLQAIFDRIATDSEQNAAKMIERILSAIDELKIFRRG